MEQLNKSLANKLRAINLSENHFKNEKLNHKLRTKSAYKNFIKEILSDSKTVIAFTLTFNDRFNISVSQAEKDARHFKNTLDKDVFGKSNNRWKNRHPGCIVIEGNDYGDHGIRTHCHGILGFDFESSRDCKRLIRRHWNKIKKSGYVIDIVEWDGSERWIKYLLKQRTKDVPYSDAIAVLDRSNLI